MFPFVSEGELCRTTPIAPFACPAAPTEGSSEFEISPRVCIVTTYCKESLETLFVDSTCISDPYVLDRTTLGCRVLIWYDGVFPDIPMGRPEFSSAFHG